MLNRILLTTIMILAASHAIAAGFADPDMSTARVRTHYENPDTGMPSQPISYDACLFTDQGIPVLDPPGCPPATAPTVFGDTSFYWGQGPPSETSFWVLELNIEPFHARCPDGVPVSEGPPHLSAPVHPLGGGGLFEFAMDARVPGENFARAYLALDIARLDDAVHCPITIADTPAFLLPFIGFGADERQGNEAPLAWIAPPGDPIVLPDTLEFTARIWDLTTPTQGVLHFSLWLTAEWGGVPRMLFVNLYSHGLVWDSPKIWGDQEWEWPIAESYLAPGADLAFLDADRLLSWCGLVVPELHPSEGDRTFRFDLRTLFDCASQAGQFRDPLPSQPTRITGIHWAVEGSSNLGGNPNDGLLKASVHGTRICTRGSACNEADLAIYAAGPTGQYAPGQKLSYTMVAAHPRGSDSLEVQARVRGILPADVDESTSSWTCDARWGAACGASSGQGPIDEIVTLPAGGALFYAVSATVEGSANDDPLLYTATVEAIIDQAGRPVVDPNAANDTAQDEKRLTRSPLFRLFLPTPLVPRGYDHLLTIDAAERDALVANGWLYEGIEGYVYPTDRAGSTPLHELFFSLPGPGIQDHFYTTLDFERDVAVSLGYADEGPAGWVSPSGSAQTKPLYRLYAPQIFDHFYTSNPAERDAASAGLFVPEGTAGWVWSAP